MPLSTSLTSATTSGNDRPPPNASIVSPCEEICAADGKGMDRGVRQAVIDRSPACAVVGREKNAAFRPCKEIRAAQRKGGDDSVMCCLRWNWTFPDRVLVSSFMYFGEGIFMTVRRKFSAQEKVQIVRLHLPESKSLSE
jgi:hypothetical protein